MTEHAQVKRKTAQNEKQDGAAPVSEATACPPYHEKIVLRRTGKKTMRFAGDKIAETTGYTRTGAHWYEISVYSRVVGGYVACVRHFNKSDQERDRFVAERFETIDEVMSYLEAYPVVDDLAIRFNPAAPELSAADVTLRAAGLRAQCAEFTHAYQAVAGEVLHTIEAAVNA